MKRIFETQERSSILASSKTIDVVIVSRNFQIERGILFWKRKEEREVWEGRN